MWLKAQSNDDNNDNNTPHPDPVDCFVTGSVYKQPTTRACQAVKVYPHFAHLIPKKHKSLHQSPQRMPVHLDEEDRHDTVEREVVPVLPGQRLDNHSSSPQRLPVNNEPPRTRVSPINEVQSPWDNEDIELEFRDVLDAPLDPEERDLFARNLRQSQIHKPKYRYSCEVQQEYSRLTRHLWLHEDQRLVESLSPMPRHPGLERRNIIARHNIKRRWQKLGVWDNQWGIPRHGHNPGVPDTWEWKQNSGDGQPQNTEGLQDPVDRVVALRHGLRRADPIISPSHLEGDVSPSQMESFIHSRPWFLWAVQIREEAARLRRIPRDKMLVPGSDMKVIRYMSPANIVTQRWKRQGLWSERWGTDSEPGWKWAHESPSPEPEDLSRLDSGDMEYTPSERDALEALPPYAPPPPPNPRPVENAPVFNPFAFRGAEPSPPPPPPPPGSSDEQEPASGSEQQQHEEAPAPVPRRSARISAREAPAPPLPPVAREKRPAVRTVPSRPPRPVTDKPERGRPKGSGLSKPAPAAKPKTLPHSGPPGAAAADKKPRGRGRPRKTGP